MSIILNTDYTLQLWNFIALVFYFFTSRPQLQKIQTDADYWLKDYEGPGNRFFHFNV
jgi:hypothetical protein